MRHALVSRYYGLMLGFFVHLARLELPPEAYASHRKRINEALHEVDVAQTLPDAPADYAERFPVLAVDLARALKERDAELADFYAFGFHALGLMAGVQRGAPTDAAIRQDVDGIVARYGLDGDAIHGVLASGWSADHIDDALWIELVGRFYRLATVAIWPLPKQPGLCFVIMPFGEPFGGYYLDFYRPALQQAGYGCIRAWVGLTNEFYLGLLATLISRCSAALADISAQPGTGQPNLNVIHEIGLNMALENLTFLIRNHDEVAIPSNFTGLQVLRYDTAPPDFPVETALDVAAHLRPGDEPET